MRIEDVTLSGLKNILAKIPDAEVKKLRFRFIQLFEKYFQGNNNASVDIDHPDRIAVLKRADLLDKYRLVKAEMNTRKLEGKGTSLDKALFRKALMGVDVASFPEIPMIPDYISITGSYLKSPKQMGEFHITIRETDENRRVEVEEKVRAAFEEEMKKSAVFDYTEELTEDYLPLFDLVLRPKTETKKMTVEKKIFREVLKEAKKVTVKKGVITYKDLGIMPEGTRWDGPAETRKADVDDLRLMAAWFDSDKPDVKGSYKLMHHKADGHKAVWRGVHAAMGVLLGARGGVDVPSNDKKGIYNHLKRHYPSWEKEVPEFRKYSEEEIEKMFEVEKIEVTETQIRIPVNPGCQVTATITIDKEKGITALYCGKIKKVRTYLFDKEKWTLARAKAWVKEHKQKMEEKFSKGIDEDAEKEMLFKIMKVDKKQQIVGGIVYEPNEVDTQGDYTSAKEIEKALYKFMERYANNTSKIKVMHKGKTHSFPILESFQPEVDTMKGDQRIKAGSWWIMVKIKDKDIWKEVEEGNLSGFSMGGIAGAEA